MKKLLSNLTARPLNLLFPVALVAGIFTSSQALASREMRIGSDHAGGFEGDPLDTNDFGGGGGFDHVHIQPESGADANGGGRTLDFPGIPVLLVPEFQGGTLIFRIIFLENASRVPDSVSLEGNHAP